jgi:hypothetical protein
MNIVMYHFWKINEFWNRKDISTDHSLFYHKVGFFVWLTPVNKIIKNDGNLKNILTGYVVKFRQTTFNKVVRTRETGELEVGFVCWEWHY